MDTRLDSKEAEGKFEIVFTARIYPADQAEFEQRLAAAMLAKLEPPHEQPEPEPDGSGWQGKYEAEHAALEAARQEILDNRREQNRLERDLEEALRAVTESALKIEELQRR